MSSDDVRRGDRYTDFRDFGDVEYVVSQGHGMPARNAYRPRLRRHF